MDVNAFLGQQDGFTKIPKVVSPIDQPLCRYVHADGGITIEAILSVPNGSSHHAFDGSDELVHLPFILGDQFHLSLRVNDVKDV